MNSQEKIVYYKKKRMLVMDEPYRFKIEPSLGCNRKCEFCGMTRNDSHLMTKELFDIICDKMPPSLKRIEFILHGEPTLNPNLLYMIKRSKDKVPKAQIAVGTNGWRFVTKEKNPDYLFDMFDSGLNLMQLTLYEKSDFDTFMELLRENITGFEERKIQVKNAYIAHENLFAFKGDKRKQILVNIEYEGLNSGNMLQRRFHTFGGNVPEPVWKKYAEKFKDFSDFPLTGKGKTCTSLLKYIPIGANGDLYLCCRDAAHSFSFGNIRDIDVREFWNSPEVHKIRMTLKAARRDLIAPCFLCSRYCYRDPLYAYWGEDYTEVECVETISKLTTIKNDVLLNNLIEYQKLYPDKIPVHIQQQITDARNRYNI